METKWFSVKRYEFEALVFGVVLLVGSWILSTQFSAPAVLILVLGGIGFIFTILSASLIILRLIARFF